jgi:hypothetical protein
MTKSPYPGSVVPVIPEYRFRHNEYMRHSRDSVRGSGCRVLPAWMSSVFMSAPMALDVSPAPFGWYSMCVTGCLRLALDVPPLPIFGGR